MAGTASIGRDVTEQSQAEALPVTQVLKVGAGQGFLFSCIEQARLQPGDGHAGRALLEHGEALGHIRRGALLHDVGKCAVPEAILLKPGPLDEDEWAVVRRHPLAAYELLSRIAYLRLALDIPYCHHEKWDGTDYPRQLKGQEIPLAARIFLWWKCGMSCSATALIARPGMPKERWSTSLCSAGCILTPRWLIHL